MSLESMVMYMESLLGTKGRPNKVTNWYANRNGSYFANAAWCNMTITYVAYQSGNYDAVCFGKDYAYTVYHAQRFQQAGQWNVDVAGIKRGDIVFFDWDGSNNVGAIDHIGIVTGVNGRDILTIEGNTDDSVARRVRRAEEIVGYGRPNYPATARPRPDVGAPPVGQPGEYVPPAFPTGLAPNKSVPSAKPLQAALKAAGYMSKSIEAADNYGPQTQAAVAKFYNANPDIRVTTNDIAIGPLGWAELHREAYGGGTAPTPTPTPADGEPAHDYRRVTFGGKTVNKRTEAMLKTAGYTGSLTQGSYNTGVSASAGTHDGGGVVDIPSTSTDLLKKLRQAGFAAWIRTSKEGFSPHTHAVAIGDKEMSRTAKDQVVDYFAGRNGLANNGPDTAPASVGRPYPAWAAKYR